MPLDSNEIMKLYERMRKYPQFIQALDNMLDASHSFATKVATKDDEAVLVMYLLAFCHYATNIHAMAIGKNVTIRELEDIREVQDLILKTISSAVKA